MRRCDPDDLDDAVEEEAQRQYGRMADAYWSDIERAQRNAGDR